MAQQKFYIKQDDTLPELNATLLDADGVAIPLLTVSSVRFIMSFGPGQPEKVNAVASIVDASAGTVKYAWDTGDTDTVGEFQGEFQLTFQNGTILTVPNEEYITIIITGDLGD